MWINNWLTWLSQNTIRGRCLSRFVIVVDGVCHILIDSLFESESLTPESLGGRESSWETLVLCISFPFGAFPSIVFGIFKEWLPPGEWFPFSINSMEYKLDERVLWQGQHFIQSFLNRTILPHCLAREILPRNTICSQTKLNLSERSRPNHFHIFLTIINLPKWTFSLLEYAVQQKKECFIVNELLGYEIHGHFSSLSSSSFISTSQRKSLDIGWRQCSPFELS